jgi:hypothetical protein
VVVVKPVSFALRTYQVGFGDCFLLSVTYDTGDARHCLIDFGTTRQNQGYAGRTKEQIAADIATVTGGKLNVVVATHRHKDHISGFSGKSGETIRSLDPQLVVQPWTEQPDLATDATAPAAAPATGNQNLVRALSSMQSFALSAQSQWMQLVGMDAAAAETDPERIDVRALDERLADVESRPSKLLGVDMRQAVSTAVLRELLHVGVTNIANKAAVESLIAMADTAEAGGHYGKYGDRLDLAGIMPGVKVRVLGPPTVDQWPSIGSQRHKDEDEFWHLRQRFWQAHALSQQLAQHDALFPDAATTSDVPFSARWAVPRAQQVRVEQLLGVVRALDSALNNTSLILMFEIGGKKLLFPGDAQIENWQYVLAKAAKDTNEGRELRELLSQVDLYKVGHHGSLNATPKTLWGMFAKRSVSKSDPDRMHSVVSTMGGVHGRTSQHTEVPRQTLMRALKAQTNLHSTQFQRKKADYAHVTEMPV